MTEAQGATSHAWIARYFKLCGDKEIDAAMEYWVPEGELQFANQERLVGREMIRSTFKELVGQWAKETHTVKRLWAVSDDFVIVELEVHFLRHDGHEATVGGVTLCTIAGELFTDQRTYVDLAPVFADAPVADDAGS